MEIERKKYFSACLWERGKRKINQDSLAFWWVNKGKKNHFFGIVCDGIGGLMEGENASTYVVCQLVSWYMADGYRQHNKELIKKQIQQLLR